MLKNKLIKRLLIIFSSLFIIFIIYIFPTKKENIKIIEKNDSKKESVIYLKDKNNYISRVTVFVKEKTIEGKIKEIINYLIINSSNSHYIKEGFFPIIPENTKLLSINIENNLVKINFSKEFLNVDESNEESLISSIVYSLTSLEEIDYVSIYVENNLLDKLPKSGKHLDSILDRSFGINKLYNITSIKGTTSTTVYYLSKNDDYYYYVPVTMVNNDKNEKMEIIINELSSKSTYQTGLISYLKASRDINYKYNADVMEVSIKDNLFNSLNDSNLIESVIYSMNLSIKENYNVKEVIYLINDNIYRSYYI